MEDLYIKLRQWMDSVTPMGFRETEDGSDIALLKRLFTPDAARLVLRLSIELKPLQTIAQGAGISTTEAETRLDRLYLEGVIRRHVDDGEKTYAALALLPGLLENLLLPAAKCDEELLHLITRSLESNFPASFNDHTGITRTVPIMTALPAGSGVAPYQDVTEMVRNAPQPIVVMNCHCRASKENRCNGPLEVCMAFGDHAQFYLDDGTVGRQIDVEEALKILKIAADGGLVHQPINYADHRLSWLCSCCGCCCINMSLSNKLFPAGKVWNIDPSAYIARVKAEACIGCGACVDRCPVHAFELQDDIAVLDEARCIGCGVCIASCPAETIEFLKRPEEQIPQIPKTWQELIDRQQHAVRQGDQIK